MFRAEQRRPTPFGILLIPQNGCDGRNQAEWRRPMNINLESCNTIRSLEETELDQVSAGFDMDRTLAFVAATALASGAGAPVGAAALTWLYLRNPNY
jgi:hypothetical protein